MWGTETQPCIRRRRQLPGTPFAVGTGLYLARTTVSRRSQVAYIGWMLAKFPSRGRPNSQAISESADKPQTLLRDSGIADGQSLLSLFAWENWSSPKAVTVVMSAASANVTTATAFAFRSGTDGSEGNRAIADMRCWLAARVARPFGRWLTCAGIPRQSAEALRGCSASGGECLASHSLLSLG